MQRNDFSYELPPHLIAQYPVEPRTASRLLTINRATGQTDHLHFSDLPSQLRPNDLLVFNNTRVIPARLFGEKETGGKVEILIERVTGSCRGIAQIRASKSPQPGSIISLEKSLSIKVVEKVDDMYLIETNGDVSLEMVLSEVGRMPLPPYIEREDEAIDQDRYQTVYAQRDGAVAAPTAGLHFDSDLISRLLENQINIAYVTLHVGAGTFQPVRVDDIEAHTMHSEYIEVDAALCNAIRETKANGGRVIAVGTTSVRCLETASVQTGWIEPYFGDTDIFIYPGYEFKMVDAMITNFHLPESTLLMLVSAFAGMERTREAYSTAVQHEYRFFSYGDAMFLH